MENLSTLDKLPLHCRQWRHLGDRPAKGTVLIVHGLGEHIGRYEQVAQRLNAWGWNVVGFDQRGHGASGGTRGDIAQKESLLCDLAIVIDGLRAERGLNTGRLLMLGHSLGGLIAARFVAGGLMANTAGALPEWFRPVDGLILSSPALDPGLSAWQRLQLWLGIRLAPHLGAVNGLKPAWISRDPEVVRAYVQDPLVHKRVTPMLANFVVEASELVRQHAADWVVPTLLLWAGSDRCVSPAGSAEFASSAPAEVLRSHCFERLFHEIFNEPEKEQVFARLQAWLDDKF
ncbi:MAG: lysophospholipase [Paucibacter sp.]|nr:lysophospholipase [Roseateles sp.]